MNHSMLLSISLVHTAKHQFLHIKQQYIWSLSALSKRSIYLLQYPPYLKPAKRTNQSGRLEHMVSIVSGVKLWWH
jgi:hypothetical protein